MNMGVSGKIKKREEGFLRQIRTCVEKKRNALSYHHKIRLRVHEGRETQKEWTHERKVLNA